MYFKRENKVRNDELEKIFLLIGNVKKKKIIIKESKDEKVIKLALLYFLDHVLLGKTGKI